MMDIWDVIGQENTALIEEFSDLIDYTFLSPKKVGQREEKVSALLEHLKAYFRLIDKAEGLDL